MSGAQTRPARIHVPSPELGTTIVRRIGFQARCERCKWAGRIRKDRMQARAEAREHVCPPRAA